jgi:hypothetical protein
MDRSSWPASDGTEACTGVGEHAQERAWGYHRLMGKSRARRSGPHDPKTVEYARGIVKAVLGPVRADVPIDELMQQMRDVVRSKDPVIRAKVRGHLALEGFIEELGDADVAEMYDLKRVPEAVVRAAVEALTSHATETNGELTTDAVAAKVAELRPDLVDEIDTGDSSDLSDAEVEGLTNLQVSWRSGTLGLTMTASAGPFTPPPLVPADPPITNPKGFYVYFHRDPGGRVFYVGMGQGRRAWSRDRHFIWHRYVEQRAGGKYTVEIHSDGLTQEDAEALEDEFVGAFGTQLVNWVNGSRQFDFEALTRFHTLRDANRARLAAARELEQENSEEAIRRYREAIGHMAEYARMKTETGLVSELNDPPCWDDSEALDRLTLVLSKLKRHEELVQDATAYFAIYPEAKDRCARGKRVMARVGKALAKIGWSAG